MNRLLIVLVVLLAPVATISAQERQVLVPFNVRQPDPQPGANGSQWTTVLSVHNGADSGFVVIPEILWNCGAFPECPAYQLRAGHTAFPEARGATQYAGPVVLTLQEEGAHSTVVRLRVQDVSREHLTNGVEVPVIDLEDAPTGRVDFLDVPAPSNLFRSALRIYGLATPARKQVFELAVWKLPSRNTPGSIEEPLLTTTIEVPERGHPFDIPRVPGNAMIDLRTLGIETDRSLRIQVESVEKLPFYALVTTTHNETQHVTVTTPVEVP